MTTLEIRGKHGNCPILIGERIEALGARLRERPVVLVSDTTVQHFHAGRFPKAPLITIGTGEGAKCLSTVEHVYRRLVDLKADRSTMLVGIGGGVVCDITGFVASTYLRGVPFAFVPTTLLAQVDAAIGGKNGINLDGYKNLIGSFRQPEFVLCDPSLFSTLSETDLRNGFAEIIKAAAIADASLFDLLAIQHAKILKRHDNVLHEVMSAAVRVKVGIVNRDETELHERRLLNFGHTLGHALETTFGLNHGEAVAVGMAFACDISVRQGLLGETEGTRLKRTIATYGLPIDVPGGSRHKLVDAMQKDKKRFGEKLHMILLKSLGQAVDVEVDARNLKELLP